jgi:pyruvate kinase
LTPIKELIESSNRENKEYYDAKTNKLAGFVVNEFSKINKRMDGISEQEQPDFEGVKQQLAEAIDKMDEIKVKHNIDEKRHSFALYTKESWILLSMIVMLLASGASAIYHLSRPNVQRDDDALKYRYIKMKGDASAEQIVTLEENDIRIPLDENSNDVTAFLAKQAVKATTKLKIRAIITDSYQGRTARNLAAFRGKYPVLAICYKEKTMRHLALSYGVEAIYMPELANGQEYYFAALRRLLQEGRLHSTDMVGYLSSGKAGTQTSFLEINVVEDALKHAQDSVLPNSNRYL